MQMLRILHYGERGKKLLAEMASESRAIHVSDAVYIVSESMLDLLRHLGADFRLLSPKGFSDLSLQDGMIESLTRQCGQLVVQRVGESEAVAFRHLCHPKPKYRIAAIVLLAYRWGITSEAEAVLEQLLFSDPDADVRGLAATEIGAYHRRSGNRRIGDMLARVVNDESESAQVRESAYRALFLLPEAFMPFPSIAFRFPDDVDWAFVDSLLRQDPIKRWYRRISRLASRLRFRGKAGTEVSTKP
jgi:hypothetical protein